LHHQIEKTIYKIKDMKNILLHPKHKRKIAEDLGVSKQTVDMSLNYVFNSFNAKKIRLKAKVLLLQEASEIHDESFINL
jgi:hypothetical protein